MKYVLNFLLEFPETEQGRNDFKSIFELASTLPDRVILFPITIEGLMTYPKIQGKFEFDSLENFNLLFTLLESLKTNVVENSFGYIKHHECIHPDGSCCDEKDETWGEEKEG